MLSTRSILGSLGNEQRVASGGCSRARHLVDVVCASITCVSEARVFVRMHRAMA